MPEGLPDREVWTPDHRSVADHETARGNRTDQRREIGCQGHRTLHHRLFCPAAGSGPERQQGLGGSLDRDLLLIASVSLILFVINELRVPDPILELRLYANSVFAITSLINWVLQSGLNGAIFLEPILIQNVLGQTALTSGLITFSAAIATGVMMPISGWIYDRYGARTITIVGVAITTWTTYMMHTFNALTVFSAMAIWMMARGVGLGLDRVFPVSELGDAVSEAEYVVLCINYTPDRYHLFGEAELAKMKPGAFLINIARGGLLDQDALLKALISKHVAGAGLDVFWEEPVDPQHPLFAQNVVATPHIAGVTDVSYKGIATAFANNIRRYARGETPLYLANSPATPRRRAK